MSNNIKIRRAELNDAQLLAEFNQKMAFETEHIHLIPEVILAGVKNLLNDENRGFYLVAESGEEIVASLMITKEWSDWRNGDLWWVQSVYVITSWRRKGLYRMLYEKVKELASDNENVCGFRLYVEKDNIAAQKTYQNVGMHETDYLLFEELKPTTQFYKED